MADPIQGLVNFVLAQKPYHTKILDLLVAYVHEDEVDVTVEEDQLFNISFRIGAELSDDTGSEESIVETCQGGWGDVWDVPGQYQVVYGAGNNIYVIGDATESFTAGVELEVRDPDAPGGHDLSVPAPDTFTVVSDATYDAVVDRTEIVLDGPAPAFVAALPPLDNDDTLGNAFITYSVVSTAITGNIITVQGTGINVSDFRTGFPVRIRSASEPALEIPYRVIFAVPGGPDEAILFVTTNVLADTVGDGQLVLDGYGYDEPPFCVSSEQTVVRPVISETLNIQTFDEPGQVPSFQYFILAADTVNDTFTVEGDVRTTLTGGLNFQVLHATLAAAPNNGAYTVDTVTFNPLTNRSTVGVTGSVAANEATGFILPV